MSECISHPQHSGGECMYCKVEELEQRIHDAYEVYAGMDGVMPESDKEVYLMRCITQMARELEEGE